MLDLSVVILSYNTKDLTLKCLKSIFQKKWKIRYEVWVVDNNSSDGSSEAIKKNYPKVQLIESKVNLGFTKGNNVALKEINSRYALLLNSDTEVLPNSLDNLIESAEKEEFDIASCKLLNDDRTHQPNAGALPEIFPTLVWLFGIDDILGKVIVLPSVHLKGGQFYRGEKEVGWVSGAAMLIKGTTLKKIGLLDEKIFMYGDDVEYCLRAKKANLKIGWTDKAHIIHLGGRSLDTPKFNQWVGEFRGLLYIYQKYYGFLMTALLRIFIHLAVFMRVIGFTLLGKGGYAKTYAKVFINT